MRLLVSILLITLFFSSSYAQDMTQLKRKPYKLSVVVNKNSIYEEDLNESTYVKPDNTVQIYPGESVFLEVVQENGIIKRLIAVQENKYPENTIIISFTQNTKDGVHEMMMLKVQNPFKQQLIYEALMYVMNGKKWVSTDVLPVEPGLFGYETWPDVITSIALTNWTFKSK
jgi:hypothetical protein